MKRWYEVKRDDISVIFEGSLEFKELVSNILQPYYSVNFIEQDLVFEKDFWKLKISENNRDEINDNNFSIYVHNNKEDESEVKYSINFESKEISLYEPSDELNLSQTLVRFIRSISRNEAIGNGEIPMHGAMVSINNKGICILGDKCAGKTTTTLLLLGLGADFVSNDDVTFRFSNQELIGRGWPRSMSLRKNVLPKLKPLKGDIDGIYELDKHPFNKNSKLKEKFAIRPQDLCRFFDVKLLIEKDVNVLIFPQFSDTDKYGIVKLSPTELKSEIIKNIEKDFNRRFIGFNRFFCYPDYHLISSMAEYISSNMVGYRLYQDFNNLERTVYFINEILSHEF